MKNVLVYLVSVAILCGILLSFSACGGDDNKDTVKKVTNAQTTTVEDDAQTVVVYVTNKKGEQVTDKDGNKQTQVEKADNKADKNSKNDKKDNKDSKEKAKDKKDKKEKKTTFTYKIIGGDTNDPAVEDPF